AEGALWPFMDALLERAPATAAELTRLAAELGIDAARFAAALDAHTYKDAVLQANRAERRQGHGPPELLINGPRGQPWGAEAWRRHGLVEARARADALLADGIPLSRLYEELTDPGEPTFATGGGGARPRLRPRLDGAPIRGPRGAPITIVVFGNLTSPAC